MLINVARDTITKIIPSMSRVCVASLGHCSSQFESIEKRPYLMPIYLQNLNLAQFSDYQQNKYSEARAFLANIFDYRKYDYVGVTTASWNIKYINKNKIDKLERWIDLDALNDKKTIICATVSSPKGWIEGDKCVMDWLGATQDNKNQIMSFFNRIGFKKTDGLVANHNQIICHKDLYIKIEEFYRSHIKSYSKILDSFDTNVFSEFARERIHAYFCEFLTMMYLLNKDIKCIPMQVCNNVAWFDERRVANRDRGLYT